MIDLFLLLYKRPLLGIWNLDKLVRGLLTNPEWGDKTRGWLVLVFHAPSMVRYPALAPCFGVPVACRTGRVLVEKRETVSGC